jgi:hypothetical protein
MIEYWIWGGAFVTTTLLLIVLGRIAYKAIQTAHESEVLPKAESAGPFIEIND